MTLAPAGYDHDTDYLSGARREVKDEAVAYAIERAREGLGAKSIAAELGGLWSHGEVGRWLARWRASEELRPKFDPAPNSYIVGAFGRRGSGKSLFAANVAWMYYLLGRPVLYNPKGLLRFPPIPGGICEFVSLREIALLSPHMQGAFVLLDEIQVNLSKYRASTSASFLLRRCIQQTRKIGLDMMVTSNSPGELDPSFPPQLDLHIRCKSYFDQGEDAVSVQWVDTQGQYGKGTPRSARGSYIDDRIRIQDWIYPASDIFQIYDHTVQTDPLEVMGLTPEEIAQAKQEQDVGWRAEDIADWLRDGLIHRLVFEEGVRQIQPASLANWIAEHFNTGYDHSDCCGSIGTQEEGKDGCTQGMPIELRFSPELLGAGLRTSGLLPRRRAMGVVYQFPENEDQYQKWRDFGEPPGE